MSLDTHKHQIQPIGDLDGPYLRDFWAAWEDEAPPARREPRPLPVLVLVNDNTPAAQVPVAGGGYLDGAGLPDDWHRQDEGRGDVDDKA
jgi:hypothetical protein